MKTDQWRLYFEDRGIKDSLIDAYIPYVDKLNRNKVPVIFEIDHLSALFGISLHTLAKIIFSSANFYREFYIPKRSGGRRKISAPHQSILMCQRWILQNILNTIKLHESAHGFCSGKSIKSNALVHLNSKCLLKMDMKDFFPSIPISWVMNAFLDLGYAKNVSFALASVCCVNGVLAQGAATSPALSNILLRGLDQRLQLLSENCGLAYSRYADDLTFSGEKIHHNFSTLVSSIVDDYGLEVNEEKTRLKLKNGSRIVTGISISEGKISVPREFKRKLKNEIFIIKKFGIISHMANQKIRNPNYLRSLLGKLEFLKFVEPDNRFAIDSKEYIKTLINR